MDKLNHSKPRVLITGSNGFLGQKLTDMLLINSTYDLCCTSASPNRNPNNIGYQFVQLDLLNHQELAQLIAEYKPNYIIHTAAMTAVEACEQNPERCKQLNVQTPAFIANICKEHNIHLTFISTDFVFDGLSGPYQEGDPTNPCNAYGLSKVAAEEAILASGCKAAILRTILVYGVIADKNRSNLVLWAKQKLSAQEPITVVSDQYRMPTWVDDLAKACMLTIEKNATGIYHISSDTLYSIIELVEMVADYWQLDKGLIKPITAASINQEMNRPKRTGFILNKANQDLDYQPHSFKNSLSIIDKQLKYFSY